MPGRGNVMTQFPVNVPVKRMMAFCDCVGPAPGVAVKPPGTVNVTLALVSDIACVAPRTPSSAVVLAFTGVSQAPASPPRGTVVNAMLAVRESTICFYVLGGVASGAGACDDHPALVNFFIASSVCADCSNLLYCDSQVTPEAASSGPCAAPKFLSAPAPKISAAVKNKSGK